MFRTMMHGKIHNCFITEACLHYIGSITIDEDLLEASGIIENQRVQVVNVTNGERLETYVIVGERGSGVICLNGAAARRCQVGDKVIVIAYGLFNEEEIKSLKPRIVFVDERNKITRVLQKESPLTYDSVN